MRLATPADIPAVMALEKDATTAAHWSQIQYERIFVEQGLKPSPLESADAGLKPRSSTALHHHDVEPLEAGSSVERAQRVALVIEDDQGVQGFLIARRLDSEFEIENVAVAGFARRRGLGTLLVGELLSLARRQGTEVVFLEVRESNRAARGLYKKCGFAETGHRKRYYQDPEETAILYRFDLAGLAS